MTLKTWRRTAVIALLSLVSATSFADTATELNEAAITAFPASSLPLLAFERALAIMQLAVYEAANACHPTYTASALGVEAAPGADSQAAMVEAGYRVMLAISPSIAAGVERDRRLAAIADSPAKQLGIKTGDASAAAVLASRENDGADFSTTYTAGRGDGVYQLTSDQPMASPLAAQMRPFGLVSYSALRPPPPATLDSAQMRRDLQEVALLGGSDSTVRTPEQTEIARFHALPGVFSWNSIARQVVEQRHLDPVASARLFAIVNEAIVDGHFSSWDAKYTYNLWRPVTAIHVGGGPLKLIPDPGWKPLIQTPMIPEYPCAHCTLGAAVQIVLEGLVGLEPVTLSVKSGSVTRHYQSFRQYAEEESASRIYAGVHYRWSNYAGESLGHQVGAAELAKMPQPLP